MKRLTHYDKFGEPIINGKRSGLSYAEDAHEAYCRLAAYENSGLTPDEVMKLKDRLEDKEYEIIAIMHSVDKWLEGDELKENTATRSAIMREKTLQIIERLQDELDHYRKKKDGARDV